MLLPSGGLFTVVDPATTNIEKGLDLLRFVSMGAYLMYDGIANDPPDPDYDIIPQPVFLLDQPAGSPELHDLVVATDEQWAYGWAALQSLERFQGAQIDGDLEAQIAQLEALSTLSEATATAIDDTVVRLEAFADVAALDAELALPAVTAAEQLELEPMYERVRTSGFDPTEIAEFEAAGFTADEIADVRDSIAFTDVSVLTPDVPLPVELDTLASELGPEADAFRDLANDAAMVALRIGLDLPNDPPTARSDNVTMTEDDSSLIDVLANDTDPDGDTLTVISYTSADHGAVGCTGSDCQYTPDPDFNGSDDFRYTITDGRGNERSATVHITVTSVNDPPVATIDEPVAVANDSILIDVLLNDEPGPPDEEFQQLVLDSIGTPPSTGTATIEGSKIRYDAPNATGNEVFTYVVCDEGTSDGVADPQCSTGTVNVTLTFTPPEPEAAATVSHGVDAVSIYSQVGLVSVSSGSSTVANALDDSSSSRWRTDTGDVTDQSFVLQVPGMSQAVDRVFVAAPTTNYAVRNFRVEVSDRGVEPGDFQVVVDAELPNDGALHEFSFPVRTARFVKFVAEDSWGAINNLELSTFSMPTRDEPGGVVSLPAGRPARVVSQSEGDAALTIDDRSSFWSLAAGTGEMVLKLGGNVSHNVDRLILDLGAYSSSGVAGFELQLSDTGTDPGDFLTVVTDTTVAAAGPQEFAFAPTIARYARLVITFGHGSSTTRLVDLDLLTGDGVNVASGAGIGAAVLATSVQTGNATLALDGNESTSWGIPSGDGTVDHSLTLRLPDGVARRINVVDIYSNGSTNAVQDVEVQSSTTVSPTATSRPSPWPRSRGLAGGTVSSCRRHRADM